jgi:hypothetical protein
VRRSANGADVLPSIEWTARVTSRVPACRARSAMPRGSGDCDNLRKRSQERYALEFARHGESGRLIGLERAAHLARLGLQPHRMETFKLSTDPDFVAKVRDVVGLYVSPPEHAIVL